MNFFWVLHWATKYYINQCLLKCSLILRVCSRFFECYLIIYGFVQLHVIKNIFHTILVHINKSSEFVVHHALYTFSLSSTVYTQNNVAKPNGRVMSFETSRRIWSIRGFEMVFVLTHDINELPINFIVFICFNENIERAVVPCIRKLTINIVKNIVTLSKEWIFSRGRQVTSPS